MKLRFDRYITLAKLGLVTALMSSYALSVGAKNWMGDQPQYHLKGPYVVLSFLLLLFCVLCGVIVNSVLKSRFSIISASGFRKRQKQRTNMARCSLPENYYSSDRNTELKRFLVTHIAFFYSNSLQNPRIGMRLALFIKLLCSFYPTQLN